MSGLAEYARRVLHPIFRLTFTMRVPRDVLVGASLGLLLLAIRLLRRLRGAQARKGRTEMIERAVQGMALFHVDSEHEGNGVPEHLGSKEFKHALSHDHHALIVKLRRLRELPLKHATIGQVRPVYRVYPPHGEKPTPERSKYPVCSYHYFIDVTADSPKDLENAFREMERIECHVDGFGF